MPAAELTAISDVIDNSGTPRPRLKARAKTYIMRRAVLMIKRAKTSTPSRNVIDRVEECGVTALPVSALVPNGYDLSVMANMAQIN